MISRTEPTTPLPPPTLALGPVRVELGSGRVQRGPVESQLRPLELSLLRRLYREVGGTVSPDVLLRDVWGYHTHSRSRTLAMTIARLRAQVEVDPAEPGYLITVHGEGYALLRPVPAPLTAPLGREAVLEAVGAWVRDGLGQLLTLYGPGGTGKSLVLRALGRRIRPGGHGVVYVDAESEGPEALADALRPCSVPRLVLADLGILPSDVLAPLLATGWGPHRLVVAARSMLDHRSEAALLVPPLDADTSAAMLDPRWPDALRSGIAEVCGGLPLALILARSAPTPPPGPSGASLWLDGLQAADGPPRHRSLSANLASTLDSLTTDAMQAWRHLHARRPEESVVDELLRAGVVAWCGDRLVRSALVVGRLDETRRIPG
ncbi:MAG: winged helix-turn-helix domain-containing protein [Alphaproteobacteria bacterium]|nr:winged helix-turn-helix domain-containing protein [Alphaproteobacteria bacterium]MCB9694644.1 winged helix-turn-helix domain-containing protein [Alphaproteobacteria bacterium]